MSACFAYHTKAIASLREVGDLVLVDVGGRVQPEKRSLVEHCTHLLIISSKPELVPENAQKITLPIALLTAIREKCLLETSVLSLSVS